MSDPASNVNSAPGTPSRIPVAAMNLTSPQPSTSRRAIRRPASAKRARKSAGSTPDSAARTGAEILPVFSPQIDGKSTAAAMPTYTAMLELRGTISKNYGFKAFWD